MSSVIIIWLGAEQLECAPCHLLVAIQICKVILRFDIRCLNCINGTVELSFDIKVDQCDLHRFLVGPERALQAASLRRGPVVCDRKGESRHHVMRVLLPD